MAMNPNTSGRNAVKKSTFDDFIDKSKSTVNTDASDLSFLNIVARSFSSAFLAQNEQAGHNSYGNHLVDLSSGTNGLKAPPKLSHSDKTKTLSNGLGLTHESSTFDTVLAYSTFISPLNLISFTSSVIIMSVAAAVSKAGKAIINAGIKTEPLETPPALNDTIKVISEEEAEKKQQKQQKQDALEAKKEARESIVNPLMKAVRAPLIILTAIRTVADKVASFSPVDSYLQSKADRAALGRMMESDANTNTQSQSQTSAENTQASENQIETRPRSERVYSKATDDISNIEKPDLKTSDAALDAMEDLLSDYAEYRAEQENNRTAPADAVDVTETKVTNQNEAESAHIASLRDRMDYLLSNSDTKFDSGVRNFNEFLKEYSAANPSINFSTASSGELQVKMQQPFMEFLESKYNTAKVHSQVQPGTLNLDSVVNRAFASIDRANDDIQSKAQKNAAEFDSLIQKAETLVKNINKSAASQQTIGALDDEHINELEEFLKDTNKPKDKPKETLSSGNVNYDDLLSDLNDDISSEEIAEIEKEAQQLEEEELNSELEEMVEMLGSNEMADAFRQQQSQNQAANNSPDAVANSTDIESAENFSDSDLKDALEGLKKLSAEGQESTTATSTEEKEAVQEAESSRSMGMGGRA